MQYFSIKTYLYIIFPCLHHEKHFNDSYLYRIASPGSFTFSAALRSLSQIRKGLNGPQYLIKPFLERSTLTVMFGESGCYKSFLATDIGLCVAYGIDFHGYRAHQGPAFYICGEGHGGIGRRIEAWLIQHDLTRRDAPFYVSELPAQLINEGDAESIGDVIGGLCEQHGNPVLIMGGALYPDGDVRRVGVLQVFFGN